jgi:hypothetical protein
MKRLIGTDKYARVKQLYIQQLMYNFTRFNITASIENNIIIGMLKSPRSVNQCPDNNITI